VLKKLTLVHMANSNKQYLIFIGKKVRELRQKMGISQERLGELAGVHRTYVGMIERGEKNITIYNLRRFADALKVKVRDLIDF
jgi:transcriptional regulator with XRE-family HTH domain